MTRYFMSIPEAAHLVIEAACLTHGQDVYILEMGESVRIVELAERMIRLRGLRPYRDIGIEFIGMRPGEELHERLLITGEARQATIHPYIFAIVPSPSERSFSLDRLKHLLNGTMQAEPDKLKQDILELARETQSLTD
jgi:FlaA1/EpsC-like NDP-sugar epimerase